MAIQKFTTKIADNGLIKLPEGFVKPGDEVEVTILRRKRETRSRRRKISFTEKWSGFLSHPVVEEDKEHYLNQKHQ